MKKILYSMAVMAAMVGTMTSCSNDEETSGSNNAVAGKTIGFNVSNGVGTRALGTTPGNYLTQVQDFQVWGYYAAGATGTGVVPGKQYVGVSNTVGVFIDGDGSGAWNYRTASDASYWPTTTAPLNFQAITPATDASFTIENTPSGNLAHVVANVTVPTDNAAQKDIMFASTPNLTSAGGRVVNLSFQHAMSQITFSAKLASTKFTAEVSGISINNIKSTGKVGYLAENDQAGAVVLGGGAADGTVANYATGMASSSVVVDDIADAKPLTAADGALIMLPQTTVKWATVDGTPVSVSDADAAKNSYLVITCKIKTTDGTYLVGSDDAFGTVYVPFAANWERSKKYNYTIVFGSGTGGFDADGNLIFQPISYSATVEDWTPVDGGTVPPAPTTGTENGYEWVDLGLPSGTLWATCNVGADSPKDYGKYFAWGETVGYTAEQVTGGVRKFDDATYQAGAAALISDDLTLEQDAAHVNLGGKWRMPTDVEFQELINNCDATWTTDYNGTGIKGYIITSNTNGKSVFFPASGDCDGSSVGRAGLLGLYWSASWYSSDYARFLYLNSYSGDVGVGGGSRYVGHSVRGVIPPPAESTPVPDLTHGTENGYKYVDLGLPSGLLWATCNVGATSPEKAGQYFAWGETVGYTAEQVKAGKRAFDEDTYNAGPAASISDDLTLEQDAAHIYLGGKWRMPTDVEFQELIDNCDVTWTKNYNGTGVAGRVFTSKTNGKSIFFPAAGRCNDSSVVIVGNFGHYRSASWNSLRYAWELYFYSGYVGVYDYVSSRCYGHSVRGVCE